MELISKKTYYHIQRKQIWNVGESHFIGNEVNNYFNYFDKNGHNYEDKHSGKLFNPNYIADCMLQYIETGYKDPSVSPFFSYDSAETIRLLRDIIWNYSRYLREILFEEVRQEFFPSYPSRKKGIWVISKKEHIPYWIKTIGATTDDSVVFEVELSGKIHEANHTHIKLTTNSFNGIRQQAFRYWMTEDWNSNQIGDECIFEGFLKVNNMVHVKDLLL